MGIHMLFLRSLICFLLVLMTTSCNAQSTPRVPERDPATITQAEAEELLRLAVQYTQARDPAKLCSLATFPDSCLRELTANGGPWGAVPADPPKVLRSFVRPDVPLPNNKGVMAGSRVLVLEGVDGAGGSYQTEFTIMAADEPGPLGNGLVVGMPYYWAALPFNNNIPAVGTDGVMRETVVAIPMTPTPTP